MQSMHVRDIHHNEGGTYTREGINKEERNFAGILEVLRRGAEQNSGRYAGTLVDHPNDPGETGTSGDPLTSRSWFR